MLNIIICGVEGISYFHFAILICTRQVNRKGVCIPDFHEGVRQRKSSPWEEMFKKMQLFNLQRGKLRNVSGKSFSCVQKKQKSSNGSKGEGGIYLSGLSRQML